MTDLITLLAYGFVQRAIISGIFISIICSLLGLFLVLRNMSFIGDGLAHVSFGALALGLFIGVYPFAFAILTVIVGSLFIMYITKKAWVLGDSAIAIVSSFGMALGIFFASLSKGFTIDIYGYLFGNILSISPLEVIFVIILSCIIIGAVYYFYDDLFSSTFDEEFAQVTGIKTNFINSGLVVLTSLAIVLSIKMVGALLVSALIVVPSVTSFQIAKSFKSAIFISILLSATSVLLGILLSFAFNIPTGATIVLINIFLFVSVYVLIKK